MWEKCIPIVMVGMRRNVGDWYEDGGNRKGIVGIEREMWRVVP